MYMQPGPERIDSYSRRVTMMPRWNTGQLLKENGQLSVHVPGDSCVLSRAICNMEQLLPPAAAQLLRCTGRLGDWERRAMYGYRRRHTRHAFSTGARRCRQAWPRRANRPVIVDMTKCTTHVYTRIYRVHVARTGAGLRPPRLHAPVLQAGLACRPILAGCSLPAPSAAA